MVKELSIHGWRKSMWLVWVSSTWIYIFHPFFLPSNKPKHFACSPSHVVRWRHFVRSSFSPHHSPGPFHFHFISALLIIMLLVRRNIFGYKTYEYSPFCGMLGFCCFWFSDRFSNDRLKGGNSLCLMVMCCVLCGVGNRRGSLHCIHVSFRSLGGTWNVLEKNTNCHQSINSTILNKSKHNLECIKDNKDSWWLQIA